MHIYIYIYKRIYIYICESLSLSYQVYSSFPRKLFLFLYFSVYFELPFPEQKARKRMSEQERVVEGRAKGGVR